MRIWISTEPQILAARRKWKSSRPNPNLRNCNFWVLARDVFISDNLGKNEKFNSRYTRTLLSSRMEFSCRGVSSYAVERYAIDTRLGWITFFYTSFIQTLAKIADSLFE